MNKRLKKMASGMELNAYTEGNKVCIEILNDLDNSEATKAVINILADIISENLPKLENELQDALSETDYFNTPH